MYSLLFLRKITLANVKVSQNKSRVKKNGRSKFGKREQGGPRMSLGKRPQVVQLSVHKGADG